MYHPILLSSFGCTLSSESQYEKRTYKIGFYNHYQHVLKQKLKNCIPKLVTYLLIQQHIHIKYSIIEMPLSNLPTRWYCSLCFFCFLPLYIFASMKLIYNSYTILKLYYSFNDRTNYVFSLQTIQEKVKVKKIEE
jgi:hypothetical protein